MDTLQGYAQKLRQVAEAIDQLLHMPPPSVPDLPMPSMFVMPPMRPKKQHWTQRPENQAKLKRQLKRATRIRLAGK